VFHILIWEGLELVWGLSPP